ncbi:unnamed protein product [Parnassius mnemosyne]|uniref:Transposase n=1 Tax=Parnassius mnemosyne TaxID=213953 RepID=A0AAV1KQE6_9NEOP
MAAECGVTVLRLPPYHCELNPIELIWAQAKGYRRSLKDVRVIAGILTTHVQQPIADEIQQWRTIRHIYTQKFFHFPAYNLAVVEIEGGGLICHGTGDPKEKGEGIVVGVTSLINVGLPSLHNRVGLYHKWITDRGSGLSLEKFMFHLCFGLILVSNKVVFYA